MKTKNSYASMKEFVQEMCKLYRVDCVRSDDEIASAIYDYMNTEVEFEEYTDEELDVVGEELFGKKEV